MKNALEKNGNRANQIEKKISKLKDRNLEQVEEDREFRHENIKKFYKKYLPLLGRATLQ